ncbi:hypothetical protein [Metapseudomonas otitidis]|uniref:hypothetical protein n=1 Tax=Metapseudomonas otitidis TaxID=319939 RepID=UPI0013F59FC6|nr:hypothetical protein [Pseudomonas otitidis]
MTEKSKFIIEAVCSETHCIAVDLRIETDTPSKILDIISPPHGRLHPAARYDLSPEDVAQLAASFSLELPHGDFFYRLRCWHRLDNLPYKTHTNRELKMMLEGIKPLASFSENHPSDVDFEAIPESLFLPYVEQGLIVKRDYVSNLDSSSGTRFVLYARKPEEWRIDAYILLKLTSEASGWSQGFERMEGALLGYEEWQNEAYIKMVYG